MPRDTQFLTHSSIGGARGYDIHTREEMMVELHESENPVPQTMVCSIRQWTRGIVPHRMTGNSPTWGLLASIYCCLFFSSSFGPTQCIMSASRLLPTRPMSSKYSTRRTSVGLFVDLATHPRSHQLLPTKHSRSGICFIGNCSGMSPSR